jgi:hypothetical protein
MKILILPERIAYNLALSWCFSPNKLAGVALVGNGAAIVLIGRCGRPPFTLVTSDPTVRSIKDLKEKVVTTGGPERRSGAT